MYKRQIEPTICVLGSQNSNRFATPARPTTGTGTAKVETDRIGGEKMTSEWKKTKRNRKAHRRANEKQRQYFKVNLGPLWDHVGVSISRLRGFDASKLCDLQVLGKRKLVLHDL